MDDAAALHGDQEGEHREDGQLDKAGEVTIIQSISLTFNGSKPVVIPNQFVVQDITVGGLLKKGSRCQRACSKYQHHMFYFDPTMQDLNGRNFLKFQASSAFVSRLVCSCVSKNASLANGTKVQELKKKRNEKLQSSVGDEDMKNKKVKPEETVVIEVGSTNIEILCPSKRANSADLQIRMLPEQLAAVFGYLKADCQSEEHSKRNYAKSGKYAKGVKKDDQ